MMILKKILLSLLTCSLFVFGSLSVTLAEEDYEGNEDYYNELCSKDDLSDDEKTVCTGYAQWMSDESEELREELEDVEAKREEIAKDIENQAKLITSLENEINSLNQEIEELNIQINDLEDKIATKEIEIEEKEKEKEELTKKVQDRMVSSQGTMRLNQQLDFLMGADSFTDFIRRMNGLNDLMDYDDYVHDQLLELIESLNEDKTQLEADKAEIEVKRDEVEKKQKEVAAKKLEAEIIQEEFRKQEVELIAAGNRIIGDLDKIKEEIADLSDKIGNIPSSTGFIKPVNGGRITAGTWAYPSGGTHLGLDIAAPVGTTLMAVSNGIIIKSVDGCPTYGALGNWCGSSQGGTSGGGNQVIMLTRVDGTLYAIKYLHLQEGTPISNSTIVSAGDKIGAMGSSGNSSGSHLHIEVYKLGNDSINDFINDWDGDLSFGCGWGTSALNRLCSNSGAPCRMRPEDALGY